MLSPLRNRFGIPGVISVVALVFAMLGGAYAANNSGGGKATASAKAKKGPRGPKGATGPAGPQGSAGANGKDGANGANGSNGATGANGTNGQSVTVTNENPGANCSEGGKKLVSVSGTSYVCNGEAGTPGNNGAPGSPWTAGGTLPVGSTETGTWQMSVTGAGQFSDSASFTVPLENPLVESRVHAFTDANFADFDGPGSGTTGCTGTIGDPTAPSGHLCVYGQGVFGELTSLSVGDPETFNKGASVAGATLNGQFSGSDVTQGTWAVTG